MRWLWWIVGIGALLAMLYTCALPGELAVGRDDQQGLAGLYAINGVDPTGVEYSGTLVITEGDTSNRFDLEWIITGAVHEGTGTLDGDQLIVEWATVSSGRGTEAGTANYVVQPDGSLVGERLVDGFDEPATEEIFPEP